MPDFPDYVNILGIILQIIGFLILIKWSHTWIMGKRTKKENLPKLFPMLLEGLKEENPEKTIIKIFKECKIEQTMRNYNVADIDGPERKIGELYTEYHKIQHKAFQYYAAIPEELIEETRKIDDKIISIAKNSWSDKLYRTLQSAGVPLVIIGLCLHIYSIFL